MPSPPSAGVLATIKPLEMCIAKSSTMQIPAQAESSYEFWLS
jgi:hypothetical protein